MNLRRSWAACGGAAALAAGLTLAGCAPPRAASPWHAETIPTDAEFRGIWFADSLNGWITGGGYLVDGGLVGRTRDGGRTWRFTSGLVPGANQTFELGSVVFRDTLRGCVVAGDGLVLVTDDGGATWRTTRHGRGSGDWLVGLQFLDERVAVAIGSASVVRSDDGGETWRTLATNRSENGYLSGSAVHFTDGSHGWLVGHDGVARTTLDGGETWLPVTLPFAPGEHPTMWDVTFVNSDQGWIVGEQGLVLHTSDGGASWKRQTNGVPIVREIPRGEPRRPRDIVPELESPPERLTLTRVRFADPERGWAIGYYADVGESVVIGTRDGGATWHIERVVPGESLRALFVLDREHAWAVGRRSRTEPQVVLRYAPAEQRR